jgi:phosphoglucosamine mutase
VDAQGNEVDGDMIMAILAIGMKAQGELKADTIVGTVMSNLGFLQAMEKAGIAVEKTPVGDRYVLELMLEKNYVLGGEQSGHVIMRKFANTGDGLLTALALAQEVARSKKSLAELASVMTRFPQILINVKGVAKDKLASNSAIADAVKVAEATLGSSGRVLLRASGTENLVRVMVEASSDNLASDVATTLAEVVRKELSL